MGQIEYWVNGDGVTQTFALPSAPVGLLQVYYNGVLLPPDQYSLSGTQVTIAFVPAGGASPDQMGFIFSPSAAPAPSGGGGTGTSALIQVSEVVNDPDFAQPFAILRSTGTWLNGVWQSATQELISYGVIADPTDREVQMIPEGDKVTGAKVFWSSQPIYGTHATAGIGGSSDILVWRGLSFRVLLVQQFEDYGFYRAMAVRMKAD